MKSIVKALRQLLCHKCYARMNSLETELAFYKPKYHFDGLAQIPGTNLVKLVREAFPNLDFHQPLEERYSVPSYTALHEYLQTDLLDKREWKERWDCNRFSFASYFLINEIARVQNVNLSYGVAFGFMVPGDSTSYHAYNIACVLNANNEFRIVLVEPQNDSIQHIFKYDTRAVLF